MLKPQGYAQLVDPDHPLQEWDSFNCAHCGGVSLVPARCSPTELGGWCFTCGAPTCQRCAARQAQTSVCLPFEQWLDMKEGTGRFRRQLDAATRQAL